MSMFLFFLWFQGSNLDQARQFFENGSLFDAEGVLLTSTLDPQDLDEASFLLFEICRKLGLDSKQTFYEGQLTHPKRRQLATGFLAISSAYRKNGHGFVRYATSYLRESQSEGKLRTLLIYHLARSSNTQFDVESLKPPEVNWYEALQGLKPGQDLPGLGNYPDWVLPYVALANGEGSQVPSQSLTLLSAFQQALKAEDFHQTTNIINRFRPELRKDPKIAAFFFDLLVQTYEGMGYPEDAATAMKRAESVRNEDPLPFRKIEFTFLDSIPQPAHVAVPEPEAPKATELDTTLKSEGATANSSASETVREEGAPAQETPETKEETPSRQSLQNLDEGSSQELPTAIKGSDSDYVESPVTTIEDVTPRQDSDLNLLENIKAQGQAPDSRLFDGPEDVERAIFGGDQNMLATLEELPKETVKDAIYADYLFGLFHLQGGRLVSAFKHLNQAELGVQAKPLPMIESKVLSALGEYYLKEKNVDQAEWYRISATQILSESRSVPMLETTDLELNLRPFGLILDDLHIQALREDVSHSLLYFFELETFIRARQVAYQHGSLSRNRVVSNQIKQMGQSLRSMAENLVAGSESSPKRYNQTLELWDQLWTKTEPYYTEFKAPSLIDIQRSLALDSRCLVFIEGLNQFGAVLISPTQSLTISFGSKEAFSDLSPSAKLDFLVRRLGSLTQFRGQFWVVPSSNLLDKDLIGSFSAQFAQAEVHYIHSLAAWFWPEQTPGCLGTLVLSNDETGPIYDWVQTLPRDGLEWFITDKVSTARIKQALPNHDHLVVQGVFLATETGLGFALRDETFSLTELFFENPDLCTLHFMTEDAQTILDHWSDLFLLRPQGRYSISIDHKSGPYHTIPLNSGLKIDLK